MVCIFFFTILSTLAASKSFFFLKTGHGLGPGCFAFPVGAPSRWVPKNTLVGGLVSYVTVVSVRIGFSKGRAGASVFFSWASCEAVLPKAVSPAMSICMVVVRGMVLLRL